MNNDKIFYKYVSGKSGSLDIITEGKMKFTNPDKLNDPFDCNLEYDIEAVADDAMKDGVYIKQYRQFNNISSSEYLENKGKHKKEIKQRLKNAYKKVKDTHYICSLSEYPLSFLMWSRYANNHKGFVVEFTVPYCNNYDDSHTKKYLCPMPVDYNNTPKIITTFNYEEKEFKEQFLTKSKVWKYEKEHRAIIEQKIDQNTTSDPILNSFDRKRILKSIIAGVKMSDNKYKELESAINDMNRELDTKVTLHRAKKESGKYSLFVPDRPDLVDVNQGGQHHLI